MKWLENVGIASGGILVFLSSNLNNVLEVIALIIGIIISIINIVNKFVKKQTITDEEYKKLQEQNLKLEEKIKELGGKDNGK